MVSDPVQRPRARSDRARYYVVEADGGSTAPADARIVAGDGRVLTQRRYAVSARVLVEDRSTLELPWAALLRMGSAAGAVLAETGETTARPLRVRIGPRGTAVRVERGGPLETIHVDGAACAALPSHHAAEALLRPLLPPDESRWATVAPPRLRPEPNRVLFFESIMSSDLPHNQQEISQGVLHLVSSLAGSAAQPVLADVKMPTEGGDGPLRGATGLAEILAQGPVHLVCVTLLEDYFDGVERLVALLRLLGCEAPVAVGGVMPSLTPEHVAAHLPDVSFVCRGAGEVIVPQLARIVGTTPISTPWSDAQWGALLALDGVVARDRAGRRLILGNPAEVVEVQDLDKVSLELSHVTARHVEGGIEISTARGCAHRCSFCSILGRSRYQARSADGILALLAQYRQRFVELHGEAVPQNAHRVHISDDNFGCDRERAVRFLQRLPSTPFRLSSVQVSIADLCRRQGRRLLPEVDLEFLDALRPECFADAERRLPDDALLEDYRARRWSSYLQIGVESFSDRELVRLAKGYRVAHVRAVVDALCRRSIHLDAYLILTNAETLGDDLVDSLEELCRLKLRHPYHFHVRYPIVQHLVSYFPSATHRKKVRRGRTHTLALRRRATEPGYPELDYPFVERDIPEDPWARSAAEAELFTDGRRYTDTLVRLRRRWREQHNGLEDGPERALGERLIRRLDDAPRQLAFELLHEARQHSRALPEGTSAALEAVALESATAVLGARRLWLPKFRRYENSESPRLVVIPTWQCQLRCRYCYVRKQDGRVMEQAALERAVDLLLGSRRTRLLLQFFGAEPLMEPELVRHGITYAAQRARRYGKELSFILSSNGWALDEETIRWLARYPVKLELSLDGDPETQARNRCAAADAPEADSYRQGIVPRADAIRDSGLPYEVIMVVPPDGAGRLAHNFFHIADQGFQRIQINVGLGMRWSEHDMEALAAELHDIGGRLRERWARGEALMLTNLEHKPFPMRLNGEVTVDYDGTVYGGNGFLFETEHKARFALGHLEDLSSFDRYRLDAPDNDYLLRWTYPADVTENNLAADRILTSFVRWMQSAGISPPEGNA